MKGIAVLASLVAIVALGVAAPVAALESVSLNDPEIAGEGDRCPALTRVMYPWASCSNGTLDTPSTRPSGASPWRSRVLRA